MTAEEFLKKRTKQRGNIVCTRKEAISALNDFKNQLPTDEEICKHFSLNKDLDIRCVENREQVCRRAGAVWMREQIKN